MCDLIPSLRQISFLPQGRWTRPNEARSFACTQLHDASWPPSLIFFFGSLALAGTKDDLMARGNEHWDRKEYGAAIQEFSKVIDMDPTSADGYYGRGLSYAGMNEFDLAIKDLTEAIRRDPHKSGAYRNRAATYIDMGQIAQAVPDLNEAIRLDPKDTASRVSRSGVYLAKFDYDSAIVDLNEAIRFDGNVCRHTITGPAHITARATLLARLRTPTRLSVYRADQARAYANRSTVYAAKGDYEYAWPTESKRSNSIRNAPMRTSSVGKAFDRLGKLDEGIDFYSRIVERDRGNAEVGAVLVTFATRNDSWTWRSPPSAKPFG